VLAGKLAIPFGSLPTQLSTYHTFSLFSAAVRFAFTEIYHKNSNCIIPENGSNVQIFLCDCMYMSGTGADQVFVPAQ
jgi:hypothetical protein